MTEEQARKIYNSIKSGKTLKETADSLGIEIIEVYGIIEILNTVFNKKIELVEAENGELLIIKKPIKKIQRTIKIPIEECNHSEVLLVSDTHLGSVQQQLHLLNELYEEAYKRGIRTAYHCGDIVDGDYTAIRKEQPRQLFLHGFDEQAGYVVDMYPKVKGLTTHFILGSHDETHYKNGQATIGFWIPKCRSDMKYLGQDQTDVYIDKVKMIIDHPGDGSAYALSYKPQKRVEELETGNKPKILAIGHYHKWYQGTYRNVRMIEVPCLCDKTQFQTKKGILNIMGGVFLNIWSDDKGNIQYFSAEPKLYDYHDTWKEAGKDANRVKRLVR